MAEPFGRGWGLVPGWVDPGDSLQVREPCADQSDP